jgi:plasmid stabilization system protein ParE
MAYELIWSPAARDDLHDIVIFIARDNSERAMSFGIELISQVNRLQSSPESGRVVPKYHHQTPARDYFPTVPDCVSSES